MVVGAEDSVPGVSGFHASHELLEAAPVDVTERLDIHRHDSVILANTPVGIECRARGRSPCKSAQKLRRSASP
jgi:hypothetical protein